jgi:hypothetical protein
VFNALNAIAIDWMYDTPPWDTKSKVRVTIAFGREVPHLTKPIELRDVFPTNTIKWNNFI